LKQLFLFFAIVVPWVFLALVFFTLTPLPLQLAGKAEVGLANATGVPLENVELRAVSESLKWPEIAAGTRVTAKFSPRDTEGLWLSFEVDGTRRKALCGDVDGGESLTITVIDDGAQCILTFGTSDAIASLIETR
jgi:hypothetical protein